jgi:epsilon-lactone hydrolase
MNRIGRVIIFLGVGLMGMLVWAREKPASDQDATKAPPVVVEADGTVEIPAESVPVSKFLSPEGKAYLIQHLKDMQNPEILKQDNGVPRFMVSYLKRAKEIFALNVDDTKIGGVHAYVYTPTEGVAAGNKNRVLIDLHGGGFSGCWPGCAELESRPVAALGKIKVVSVDYREGPENKFPAASEDVAKVYKELLKTYKPENIGIYGCSAGGMLTGQSVAWLQKHDLPRPGAVGIFCASVGEFGGDAGYTSAPLGEARMMPEMRGGGIQRMGYFSDADMKDPLVVPIESPEMLAKFPATLLITGTRAVELSAACYTHSQLVKQGVDAELHVWEGMFHGFFYNPDVPESREAYDVMVKFFDRHLGK